MTEKGGKKIGNQIEVNKVSDPEPIKEHWSQHKTTLIAYEAQYVYNKKPQNNEEDDGDKGGRRKPKKKDTQYDKGFIFSDRGDEKQINVVEMIKDSKYNNLKQLFSNESNLSEDMLQLRTFVKIMLELKHHSIIKEFMEIYDLIIRQIKDVKFEAVRIQADRVAIINKIADMVTSFIQKLAHNFKIFIGYLRDDKKETTKLFKVTIYCFLAERHNFNINQYYAEAFQLQEEPKVTKKKRKTENHYES